MEEEKLPQEEQREEDRDAHDTADLPASKLPNDSGRYVSAQQGTGETGKPKTPLVEIVKDDNLTTFEKRMFWLTVGGVFLAGLTGFVFYLQFREMSSQTKILSDQAKTAHADSMAAIQGANSQVEIERKTMSIGERAWIGISAKGAIVRPPLPLSVELNLNNIGKTPAWHSVVSATTETAASESDLTLKPKKGGFLDEAEIGTVLPGAVMNLSVAEPWKKTGKVSFFRPLTEKRMNEITHGDTQIFTFGKVTYDDIFGIHHWVTFCYAFQPNALKAGELSMMNCQKHNDIDKNPQ